MGDAILTREEVANLRAAFRLKSTGGAKTVSDLCDTVDLLRARLERAEEARDRLLAAIRNEIMIRPIPRSIRETYDEVAAALGAAGERGEG